MEHEALFEGGTLNPNLRCRTLKSLVPLPSRKSALSRRTARCEASSRWSATKNNGMADAIPLFLRRNAQTVRKCR